MFQNYQELFLSYAEFYGNHFFRSDEDSVETSCHSTHPNSTICSTVLFSKQFPQQDYSADGVYIPFDSLGTPLVRPVLGSRLLNKDGQEIVIGSFHSLTTTDIICISSILFSLILAKRLLSSRLKTWTFLDKLGLELKDRQRLDECIWRLIFYGFSSSWLIYTCFLKREAQLYLDPNQIFSEYSFTVDWDEYIICMIEVGFYLHATYALVFEDVWRRDSYMMFVHHLAAVFSFAAFYATRTHRIGLTAVVLRDTCDVLLEVTKLAMCLRIQHGKIVKSLDLSVQFFMMIFTLIFVVNQLYYYPLFCLYHALNLRKMYNLKGAVVNGILTCGLVFLLLDLIWFMLILRLIYRRFINRAPLKDIREYED